MKRMDTYIILGIAAALCVLITGYVMIAFLAYGQGHSAGYKKGLDDGIKIVHEAQEKQQHP